MAVLCGLFKFGARPVGSFREMTYIVFTVQWSL